MGIIILAVFRSIGPDHDVIAGEIWVLYALKNMCGVAKRARFRKGAKEEKTGNQEMVVFLR